MWNQGQIGPKLTRTTDIRKTPQMPLYCRLTAIMATVRSILFCSNCSRSFTESQSVPCWLMSCNKLHTVNAKHSLFWRSVCKIMPGWNWCTVWKSLPTNCWFRHCLKGMTFQIHILIDLCEWKWRLYLLKPFSFSPILTSHWSSLVNRVKPKKQVGLSSLCFNLCASSSNSSVKYASFT